MPDLANASRARPRLDFASWALRILLALVFLFEGFDKLGSRRLWIRVFAEIGVGQWLRYATGIVEIVAAVLILVPPATTIATILIGCTMAGAFLAHVFVIGIGPQTGAVAALFAAAMAIGWKRWSARRGSHNGSSA